jgi:hypothetical protein
MQITDATGAGFAAKVDSSNRLRTRGVTSTEVNEEATLGNAYLISSGLVTLTSAAESAVLYLRNDEDDDLVLTRFIGSARASTGGSTSHALVTLYSNPTGLTGGSGSDVVPKNLNFGSTNTLLNTSELGQQGASIDGGEAFSAFVIPLEGLSSEGSSIVLPKGASIGISVVPPTGNTSLTVGIGINAHLASQGVSND